MSVVLERAREVARLLARVTGEGGELYTGQGERAMHCGREWVPGSHGWGKNSPTVEYVVRGIVPGEKDPLCPRCVFITAVPSTKLFACGGGGSGGHVLRENISRGLCGLVCPSRTSERGGEGY
jgi:hypothetical protein